MNDFFSCCCSKIKEPKEFRDQSENISYFNNSNSCLSKANGPPDEVNLFKNLKEEDKSQKNSQKQTSSHSSNNQSKLLIGKGYPFNIKDKSPLQLQFNNTNDNDYNDNENDDDQSYNILGQYNDNNNNTNKGNEDILMKLMSNYNNTINTDISGLFSTISITKEVILSSPIITIKEIEGKQLNASNGVLKINAGGLINGARNKADGVSLFGWSIKSSSGNIVNDFAFKRNTEHYGSEMTLFLVYFNQQKRKYYIRCYYESLSSYMSNYALSPFMIRINKPYALQIIEFLMIGDLFFIVTIDKDKGLFKITKKRNKKYNNSLQKTFSTDYNQTITIGRDSHCIIPFQDNKSFSKVHCSFYYNSQEELWYLKDGIENNPSTNGVWMVPKKSFEIYDGMWFKIIGSTKCQMTISNN